MGTDFYIGSKVPFGMVEMSKRLATRPCRALP